MTEESDLWRSIQEMQSSNRVILQRLQQILIGQNSCVRPCHSKDRETELENLMTKLKRLEEREKKKDEEIIELKTNFRALKEILDKVQTTQTVQFMPNEISHRNIMPLTKVDAYYDNVDQNGTSITKVNRSDEDNQLLKHVSEDSFATVGEDSQTQPDGDAREEDRASSKVTDNTNAAGIRQTHLAKKEYSQDFKRSNVVGREASDFIKRQSKTSFVKSENFKIRRGDIEVEERERPCSSGNSRIGDSQSKQSLRSTTQGKPSKVNFLKTPPAETLGVKVIEQREKRTINPMDWDFAALQERMEAKMSGLAALKGIHTVVCVDISYSMSQHNAWKQTKTFFTDLVEGLKESLYRYDVKAESVAMVTFGHKTEVLKRLTQDFASLQTCFEGVSLGGPSPLYGGLLFSLTALLSTSDLGVCEVNGITVFPRLVLITDGHRTDTNLLAGPDEATLSARDEACIMCFASIPSKTEATDAKILELMQKMEGYFDVLCVPVGDADKDFLQLMATVSNGEMLTYKDGRKVGTRLRKILQAGSRREAGLPFPGFLNPTDSDEEDVAEILEADEKRKLDRQSLQRLEIPTKRLPEIGSRVRRGPDWKFKGQDSDGSGTVIGHSRNGEQIWVEWDNKKHTNIYRYGDEGCYDVLIVDEPRMPEPNGDLAVGCIVKPGKDWQESPGNVNLTSRGVVVQVDRNEIVKVRWKNKERGDYVHKPGGTQQVEFSPPEGVGKPEANISTLSYAGVQGYTSQSRGDSEYLTHVPTKQRNKNKNKNLINKKATEQ